MITGILIAAALVGGTGLVIGLLLGVAGKKFAVEVNEKEIAVREQLPGNNCGGCGYPGCDGLAAAIAAGKAPVKGCPVGGNEVAKAIDGNWYEKEHVPQRPLEEARTEKLDELNSAFTKASQTAHCTSSLGFEIDADEIANRNIEGLALVLESGESTLFRAYDNSFHQVTKEQLETMRREIVLNSQRLYQIKWQIEAVIEAAQTVDELDAIDITIDTVAREEGEGHGQTA